MNGELKYKSLQILNLKITFNKKHKRSYQILTLKKM